MLILSAKEIREADANTIANEPIKSIDLMERAAKIFVENMPKGLHPHEIVFKIFCGTGNNGGDGLAIARMLREKGDAVEVFIVRYSSKSSDDFIINEKRLKESPLVKVYDIFSNDDFPTFSKG